MLHESFSVLNEGKHWPEDYMKSSLNKLIRRFNLEDEESIADARFIVRNVLDTIDECGTLTHNSRNYALLDKVITWICDNVHGSLKDISMFNVRNLGKIAKGLEVMLASDNPQWQSDMIKKMSLQEFLANAEEAKNNAVIDADPSGKTYKVIPIESFQQINQMFGGLDTGGGEAGKGWCHASNSGHSMYDVFTDFGDAKMYVIAQDGWEDIDPPDPSSIHTAYDDYGMSLIAIAVKIDTGKIQAETLRWNHAKKPSNGEIDAAFNDDWDDLNKACGFDVEAVVKEDLKKERKKKESLKSDPQAYAQQALDKAKRRVPCGIVPKNVASVVKHLEIPEGVQSIDDYAFENFESLESIVIPSTMKHIGARAFRGCASLRSIQLPDGLQTIGAAAFCMCDSLEEVIVPASTMSVGSYAFGLCKGLKRVEILGKNTLVSKDAFGRDENLESIDFIAKTLEQVQDTPQFPFGAQNIDIIHGNDA